MRAKPDYLLGLLLALLLLLADWACAVQPVNRYFSGVKIIFCENIIMKIFLSRKLSAPAGP